ncbi:MAG: hypothetical protein KKA79_03690 [Nanoarchaeota archaeon]|nr:hypothetical protein [Nanoarchaeota archaeon]
MRSKTDVLLIVSFTLLILSTIFLGMQNQKTQITGYASEIAKVGVCVGPTPSLVPIGDLSAETGAVFSYDVNHSITNDEPVIYADTASFFTITQLTGEISFTPEEADIGNHTIAILVNNTACTGLGDSEELTFEIKLNNSAPILETIGNHTVWEDDLVSIDVNATDPDGDNITYACNTTLFTINETTGLIEWAPINDHVGLHWFDCNATDDYGAYDSEIFYILVNNINDIPILDVIPNFTVESGNPLYEDRAFYVEINATDPDGDEIEYLDNTSLFTINSETGVIYFYPSEAYIGNHSVEIYVTDNIGPGIAQQVVLFEILEVNDAPVLDLIGAQTARVNGSFYFDVNATDEEDGEDNLEGTGNLTFIDDTGLFDINSTTGVIRFTPSDGDLGNYTINISVVDKGIPSSGLGSATDSENISFTVTEANRPPNITSYEPEDLTSEVTVGECLQFSVTVTDPDGTIPTVKWYLDEVFTNETGNSYNYCPASASIYNLTALATDGELDDLQEWTITAAAAAVTPAPSAPGSGGAGGGKYFCKELWVCTDWSSCMIMDLQIRTCEDINECGTMVHKLPQTRVCIYVPIETCFDGVRNQNEILPDCGGACNPCPTCNDGICNQGELCELCEEDPNNPRCLFDIEGNILIDCGGPCPLCPRIEKPLQPKTIPLKTILIKTAKISLVVILLLLLALIIFIKIMRKISKNAMLTEQEKEEIGLVKEINDLIKYAEKAIDMKDMRSLKLICANIENRYNNLSSTKNKKKMYPKIKRLKRVIRASS